MQYTQDKSHKERWDRKTLKLFLFVEEFRRSTKSPEAVSLHAPSKECRGCKENTEILVYPSLLCGSCWVRRSISILSNGHSNGGGNGHRTSKRWLALFEKYGVDPAGYLPGAPARNLGG